MSVDGGLDAYVRFRLDGGNWYRLDGYPAFTSPGDLADLANAVLPAPWLTSLSDVPDSGLPVWTGGLGNTCSSWSSPANSARVGDPRSISPSWWSFSGRSCDAGALHYCLQE